MSSRDLTAWLRTNRRAGSLSPELAADIRRALRIIQDSLSDAEVARLISSGQLDQIIDDAILDRAFQSSRTRVREIVEKGYRSAVLHELPNAGKVDGTLAVAFDTLDPNVITAVRQLDTEVIQTLKDDVRETVRAFVENGLRDGVSPKDIGRNLRSVIGMSPTQAENAAKYEAKLRALTRPLSEAAIEKRVATYRRKAIALNAETNARTATLDALKLGQKLSWDDAIAQGMVDPSRLTKTWVTVGDDRVRDEHVAMHGETVPYDQPYSNGEMIPGDSTYNCRCISRFSVASPSAIAA